MKRYSHTGSIRNSNFPENYEEERTGERTTKRECMYGSIMHSSYSREEAAERLPTARAKLNLREHS